MRNVLRMWDVGCGMLNVGLGSWNLDLGIWLLEFGSWVFPIRPQHPNPPDQALGLPFLKQECLFRKDYIKEP